LEALANPHFEIPFTIAPGVMSLTAPPSLPAPLQKTIARLAAQSSNLVVYIDELDMPKRPIAHAVATDCEVFIKGLPAEGVDLANWLIRFGSIHDAFRLQNTRLGQVANKGYVRFQLHEGAEACVKAGIGSWSESERASDWQSGPDSFSLSANTYPYSLVSALLGENNVEIENLRMSCGISQLRVEGVDEKLSGHRLHFVATGLPSAVATVRSRLEKRLAEIHEDMTNVLKERRAGTTSAQNGMSMWSTIVHIDELRMSDRPNVEAAEKDREVWVPQAPRTSEEMMEWSSTFGEIEKVFPITLPALLADSSENKGYVLFRSHASAKQCVYAGIGTWSESERAMSWEGLGQPLRKKMHTYPISIVSTFNQNGAECMKDIANRCGIASLTMCGENVSESPASKQLHFVAEGGSNACMKTLLVELETKLAEVHGEIRKMAAHEALKSQWTKEVTADERSNDERSHRKRRRDRHGHGQRDLTNESTGNGDEVEGRSDQAPVHNPYLGAYVDSELDLGREAKRARPRPSAKPSSAPRSLW